VTNTLARPTAETLPASAARPLTLEDIPALRLPGPRSELAARQSLQRFPRRSVWIPQTLEYALLGQWRHRAEIANVEELVAARGAESLLHAALERCTAEGDTLMLAIEQESSRRPTRYERAGMELLEEVITYELDIARLPTPSRLDSRLRYVTAGDANGIDLLYQIDEAAFPWLWRNSRAEFEAYLQIPSVDVALIEKDGQPVAYIGTTLFNGWSHLDRIAVLPELQGQHLGREALQHVVIAARGNGARRIALSTQRTNVRSQRLYERFGFERTPELDYRLVGAWCRAQPAVRE
jgi:ribosomal protein S18 acetylase RimI-like enzyme